MKIVHLMKQEKFTRGISEFYDCYFNNGEHEICYVNVKGNESLINSSLTIKQSEVFLSPDNKKDADTLVKHLCKYDWVVLHSLFFTHYTMMLYPKLIKKIVWIAWGYDLYNWPPKAKGLKEKISCYIGNYIRSHCGAFVGIFPPDCDEFKKSYPKSRTRVYYAPYCGARIPEQYQNYSEISNLEQRAEDGEPIYIQIGHSAVKSVNHIAVLDSIEHLKDENIRIFLPLSYGDREYGDEVQQYAEKIYGDKVICLRDFLPKNEYFSLLKRVDIAVFNTQRQIGLGNINNMAFRNVKIYMPENSVMYQYYIANGVPIQKYEDLQNISFTALKEPIKSTNKKAFDDYIAFLQSMDKKVEFWKTLYDDLMKLNSRGR